jgi:two-component system, chemotaxis family, chemotaxis protein CheY
MQASSVEEIPTAIDVLIVDDSPAMRRLLRRTLGMCHFALGRVVEAADGQEALDILQEITVGLVLLDVNMPKIDGVTLLKLLQQRNDSAMTPTVVVSTDGSRERIDAAIAAGAKGYVCKPFRPEELERAVTQALGANYA